MTEDARECVRKKVMALLLDEPARPHGSAFKVCHDLRKEAEVTGVVGFEWAGDVLITNAAQGLVGP